MGIVDKVKALVRRDAKGMQFDAQGAGAWGGYWGDFATSLNNLLRPTRQTLDYSAVDPRNSSAFAACLSSYVCALGEPRLVVVKPTRDGAETFTEHPALDLLAKPNPNYSISALWQDTTGDYWADGNSFWLAELSPRGLPVAFWAVPPGTIRPRWPGDGSQWISGWERYRDGAWYAIEPNACRVVHFRAGDFDWGPNSLGRLAASPVRSALSDIFTDDEASTFVATVLKNLGVPGAIFSPRNPDDQINPEQRAELKAQYEALTSGKNRGRAIVFGLAMELQRLGFTPSEIDMGAVMNRCESRIAAVMNVPAAIAGLQVGMESASQRANYEAANRQFWQNGVVPLLKTYGQVLTDQVLSLYPNTAGMRIEFDLSGIAALQEDANELHRRIRNDYRGDIITRNEARVMMGLDALTDEDGDVFYSDVTGKTDAPMDGADAEAKALRLVEAKLSRDPSMAADLELASALWRERVDARHRLLLEAEST